MEKEPTLLDYARFHGLAAPFDSINCFSDFLASNPPQLDLSDPPGCQNITALASPSSEALLSEKLVVGRNVAQRIARNIRPPELPPWSAFDEYLPIKDLRVELPLLLTDPDLDLKQFLAEGKRPDINLSDLQPIPVDEDNDEGLTFPRRYLEAARPLNRQIAKEKLDTTREVLSTIRRLLEHRSDPDAERQAVKEDLCYHRSKARDPLTPLLMPLDEEKEPFIPSSPALRLELLSDRSDPCLPSREQLDEEISQADRITIDDCGDADAEKVKKLLEVAERGPRRPESINVLVEEADKNATQRTTKGLKLEPLLLPLEHLSSPKDSQRDDFASFLEEAAPSSNLDELKVNKPEDLLDREKLGRIAQSALEKINASISGEQIDNIEAIGRVSVPVFDPIKIMPPWKSDSATACLENIAELQSAVEKDQSQASDDLDRSLKWNPLTKRWPEVSVNECISGAEEIIARAIKLPTDIIKSGDILRKPDRLQILKDRDESAEEEITEDADLAVELRNAELNQPKLPGNFNRGLVDKIQNQTEEPNSLKRSAEQPFEANMNAANLEARMPINSSAISALPTFLQTRGRKYRKLEPKSSPYFAESALENPQISPNPVEVQVLATPEQSINAAAPPMRLTYPSPPKVSLSTTRALITNTALLSMYSSLIHRLEIHSPHPPQIIFRDFKLDVHSPSSCEPAPDIILSPTTALIIIPLHSIVQRALPGQGPTTPLVQTRISSLASQFDRLFILTPCKISEDCNLDTNTMSALTTLTALCASLGPVAEAQIILIPPMTALGSETDPLALIRGEKPTLNHHLLNWILALVEQHGFPSRGLVLLIEETTWEAFLRRARLNPFAAQVLLGVLKRRAQHHTGTKSGKRGRGAEESWGIRRLIQMGQEEREHLFECVVGRRAIERLGRMLDSGWEDFGRALGRDGGLTEAELMDLE